MKNENINFKEVGQIGLKLNIGPAVFLKMFLRGVYDLSFVPSLHKALCQVKKGERVAHEMSNGDRIVAVRDSAYEASILSVYNKNRGNEDVSEKVKALAASLFNVTFSNNRFTSSDMSLIKKAS